MLRGVAGARTEPEAELIVQRLAQAGISAVSQLSSGNPEFGASGGRTIYVEEDDVERARAALADAEQGFSDEELAELSEQAAREARERGGEG
jgi:flagellar biosynthesis/type III secretory pathway M-ring protein FliF/YscJ